MRFGEVTLTGVTQLEKSFEPKQSEHRAHTPDLMLYLGTTLVFKSESSLKQENELPISYCYTK